MLLRQHFEFLAAICLNNRPLLQNGFNPNELKLWMKMVYDLNSFNIQYSETYMVSMFFDASGYYEAEKFLTQYETKKRRILNGTEKEND